MRVTYRNAYQEKTKGAGYSTTFQDAEYTLPIDTLIWRGKLQNIILCIQTPFGAMIRGQYGHQYPNTYDAELDNRRISRRVLRLKTW